MNASAYDAVLRLRPLLEAEAAAEALPGGIEADDLQQAVWLRLLELPETPADPADWLRAAVRAEAARENRTEHRFPVPDQGPSAEERIVAADRRRTLRTAVRRLPGRCPRLVEALMARSDPTYREISHELGISQGSLGPLRSRCLGCLRSVLGAEVAAPTQRGTTR